MQSKWGHIARSFTTTNNIVTATEAAIALGLILLTALTIAEAAHLFSQYIAQLQLVVMC
jgi:hypothetical protein